MHDLTKGNPLKLIIMFTGPLLIGNIFQQLYSVIDTLIVGRTIGVNALAAVGSTGGLNMLIIGFCTGTTAGLSIMTRSAMAPKIIRVSSAVLPRAL